ncbi:MAG TPA: zinc ribbon domain-containing protein [Syntrophomonadaceae bacterium]|nr:zinc ribbon domain-containing protein [Syntrophomonadaceae bacterium]
MPVYDYKCEECGRFEYTQRITEDALTVCPTCGHKVQRLISKNVAIILKGSGFYKNDSNQNLKDRARTLNQERQKDNAAILDGDVKSFVEQSENTTKKILDA